MPMPHQTFVAIGGVSPSVSPIHSGLRLQLCELALQFVVHIIDMQLVPSICEAPSPAR